MANLVKFSLVEIIGLVFAIIGAIIVFSVFVKYFGFGIKDIVP